MLDGMETTGSNMRIWLSRAVVLAAMILVMPGVIPPASAQQFNSDNYLTMPYGTETVVVTYGTRNATIVTSFALAPSWEFFVQANLFRESEQDEALEHFSTNMYAKYMFVENEAKNGGFAVMGGIGGTPGYYHRGEVTNSFRTYWASAPLTLPFVKGRVLLDLMPGFQVDLDRGPANTAAWSVTHSTRVNIYGIVPQSAIVGEIYGSSGHGATHTEYKAGLRWEPHPKFALAATYSRSLDGTPGAGFEVGFILFSPRFLCRGGCPE